MKEYNSKNSRVVLLMIRSFKEDVVERALSAKTGYIRAVELKYIIDVTLNLTRLSQTTLPYSCVSASYILNEELLLPGTGGHLDRTRQSTFGGS